MENSAFAFVNNEQPEAPSALKQLLLNLYPTMSNLRLENGSGKLHVCHLNVQSLNTKFTEFAASEITKFDVITLSETWETCIIGPFLFPPRI